MGGHSLGAWRFAATAQSFYLDTSALVGLAALQAQSDGFQAGLDANALKQGRDVQGFAGRAAASGASLLVTVLAFEELAAMIRNKARANLCKPHPNWGALKKADRLRATTLDALAQQQMLKFLECAERAARSVGAKLLEPEIDDPSRDADLRAAAHRKLLEDHVGLDAMDALHIVIGGELEVTGFVSFDRGWRDVKTITVLGH